MSILASIDGGVQDDSASDVELFSRETLSFIGIMAVQAFGPMFYDVRFRRNFILQDYTGQAGLDDNWDSPYETGFTDFAD